MGKRNLVTFHSRNFDFLAPEGFSQEYLVKDGWAGFVLYDRKTYDQYQQSDCYLEVYNIITEDIDQYIDDQVAIHGNEPGFLHKVKPIKEVELRYLCFEGQEDEKQYEAYYVYDFSKGIQIKVTVKGETEGTRELAEEIFVSFQSNIEYQKVFQVTLPKAETTQVKMEEPVSEDNADSMPAKEPESVVAEPSEPAPEPVPETAAASEMVAEPEAASEPVAAEAAPSVEEVSTPKAMPVIEAVPEPVEFVSYTAFQLKEQLDTALQIRDEKVEELNVPYKEAQNKLDELTNQERDFMSQKSDLTNEIANTGIFKAGHKKELQQKIQEIDLQLVENRKIYETTRSQMNQIKKKINEEKASVELMEQVFNVRINYMEGERGITNQEYINDMFYVISKAGRPINASDICNSSEILKDMDDNKFITLLRSMMVEDKIEKIGDGEAAKYKIIRKLI